MNECQATWSSEHGGQHFGSEVERESRSDFVDRSMPLLNVCNAICFWQYQANTDFITSCLVSSLLAEFERTVTFAPTNGPLIVFGPVTAIIEGIRPTYEQRRQVAVHYFEMRSLSVPPAKLAHLTISNRM